MKNSNTKTIKLHTGTDIFIYGNATCIYKVLLEHFCMLRYKYLSTQLNVSFIKQTSTVYTISP